MNIKFIHALGDISLNFLEKKVSLKGKLKKIRNLGKILFLIIEDATGQIQVTCTGDDLGLDPSLKEGLFLCCTGILKLRETDKIDEHSNNGQLEVIADSCFVENSISCFLNDPENLDSSITKNLSFNLLKFWQFLYVIKKRLDAEGFMEVNMDILLSDKSYSLSQNDSYLFQNNFRLSSLVNSLGLDKFYYSDFSLFYKGKRQNSIHIGISVYSIKQLTSLCEHVLSDIFVQNKADKFPSFVEMHERESLSQYGTITPDLRYDYLIQEISILLRLEGKQYENYKNAWIVNIPFKVGIELNFLEEMEKAIFCHSRISFVWGNVDEHGTISGPIKNFLSSSFFQQLADKHIVNPESWMLFFLGKNKKEIETIGSILSLTIKRYAQEHTEKFSLCWVHSDKKMSTLQGDVKESCLIYNGTKVATCTLTYPKLFPVYYSNSHENFIFGQGEIYINLSSLLQISDLSRKGNDVGKLKITSDSENKIQNYLPCIYMPLMVNTISVEEIDIIGKKIEHLEKKEISRLFGKDRQSSYFLHDDISSFKKVLSEFAMSWEDVEYLIDLIPSRKDYLLNLSREEAFQFFWSILGHTYVQGILRCSENKKILEFLCSYSIIKDHKQILYIHPENLDKIRCILEIYIDGPLDPRHGAILVKDKIFYDIIKLLRLLVNNFPNNLSNITLYLFDCLKNNKRTDIKLLQQSIIKALKEGINTPALIDYFINNKRSIRERDNLGNILRSYSSTFFQNIPLDPYQITAEIYKDLKPVKNYYINNEDMLFAEMIYHLFNPINMDICVIHAFLKQLRNSTEHFRLSNINFGGKNWNPLSQSFHFVKEREENQRIQIFPSKNIASFFAKASAGICTARDIELFHNPFHFHLNLVNPWEKKVVGNIQLYLVKHGNKRSFLLRGLNPSSSFLTKENSVFILNSIFASAIQIARHSDIESVLLCPSLGIWRVESSRMEIIILLKKFTKNLPLQYLDEPYFLFRFGGQDKFIESAYRIWDREEARE